MRYAAAGLWMTGQNDAAIVLAKTMRDSDRGPLLAMIYASLGRYSEAADALNEIGGDPDSPAAAAARLLRSAPARTTRPEKLPNLPNRLEFAYLYAGAPDRVLDNFRRAADADFFGSGEMMFIWHPAYAAVRRTQTFKEVMRKAGIVDYWRAKGWPPQCHPTTADDFECS